MRDRDLRGVLLRVMVTTRGHVCRTRARLLRLLRYQSQISRIMRALARSCFSGVTYLGSVFEELLAKVRALLVRFKKPEKDYYPVDYPDDWTL